MKLAWRAKKASDGTGQFCSECGKKARGDEAFCMSCGRALGGSDGVEELVEGSETETASAIAEETVEGPPSSAPVDFPYPKASWYRRLWKVPRIGSLLAMAALLAIGGFAYLWHGERVKHHAASRELDRAHTQIDELNATRARLSAQLAAEQQLAAKRAAVLKRADKVLRGVESLLSSVDELKSITGDIQDQRNTFASDSATLVDDLVALGNYLLAPGANDYSYVQSLIDNVNAELDTVRADQDSLTSSDDSYFAASGRFDTRATALTRSVRALEKQLHLVTK